MKNISKENFIPHNLHGHFNFTWIEIITFSYMIAHKHKRQRQSFALLIFILHLKQPIHQTQLRMCIIRRYQSEAVCLNERKKPKQTNNKLASNSADDIGRKCQNPNNDTALNWAMRLIVLPDAQYNIPFA